MYLHHCGIRLRLYLTQDYKPANSYRNDAQQQQHYSRAIHDFILPRKWEMDARAFYCKEKWEGIPSLP
jgi:hypothetical protein